MDDLLSLERVVFFDELIQRKPCIADLDSFTFFFRWAGKHVDQNGVCLQMSQIKVINSVFKAKEGIVDWSVRHSQICSFSVMVVKVNSQERLDFLIREILAL